MTTAIPSSAVKDSAAATSVLVLTQRRTPEMQPAFTAIRQNFPDGDVRVLADVAAVAQSIHRDRWFPDLVVICQHWPGQFTAAKTHDLLGLLPLARWICIRGGWCESDGRNGTAWPDAVSVRARSAMLRIALERRVLNGSIAALPLTASRDEILAFEHQRPDETLPSVDPEVRQAVAVISSDAELRRSAGDLLMADGYCLAAFPPTETPLAAVVWDADPISPARFAEVQRLRETCSSSVIIALSNMAYPEDVETLSACGMNFVVAKSHLAEMLTPTIATALAQQI